MLQQSHRCLRLVGGALCLWLLLVGVPTAQFPDAHDAPPIGWTGPVFQLRQDYPPTPPPAEVYPWKAIDFRTQPEDYLRAVLAYCYEGNIDPSVDWEVQKNTVRGWYHAPWMHYGSSGREFIHGLTRERSSRPGELHPNQTQTVQNWAVSIYNPPGGHVLGQVWNDPAAPNPSAALFADGTVSVKLLFTQATDQPGPRQVPFLLGAKEWKADINRNALPDGSNVPSLRLLQIDLAVRDVRADETTGWIFGTFIYNGNAPGDTVWKRLVPVGLMWGNDPGVTPADVASGTALVETWLNPAVDPLMTHYGWAGRLNGPVDNPQSSCLSCHSTAQAPEVSALAPTASMPDAQKLYWFRNIKAGELFDNQPGVVSLDYSLQLSDGIQRFQESGGALFAANIGGREMAFTAAGQRVFPVSRDEATAADDLNLVSAAPPRPAASKPDTVTPAEKRAEPSEARRPGWLASVASVALAAAAAGGVGWWLGRRRHLRGA